MPYQKIVKAVCLFVGLVALSCVVNGCAATTPPAETPTLESKPVRQNLNNEFKSPDMNPEKWKERFEREGREVFDQRDPILKACGIRLGQSVADIGAGSGMFALMFAETVGPHGVVYAVEISEQFVAMIDRRVRDAHLKNVKSILCTDRSTELQPNSIHLAFASDTYHHFEYPQSTLASIHQALRQGGHLIIVDFKKVPGESSDWIMNHVRASEAEVIQEVEAAGFKLVETVDLLQDNYFLRFRKVTP